LNALCLALCVFIKDQGLIREEDTPGATTPAVVEEDVEKSIAEKSHDPSRRPSTDSAVAAHQPGVLDNGKSDAIR